MNLSQDGFNTRYGTVGFWQMEQSTVRDIWDNFAIGKRYATVLLSHGFDPDNPIDSVLGSLVLQIMFARLHYRRDSKPIPMQDDYEGQAEYYKRVYNTAGGKGSSEKFLKDNKLWVG